MEGSALGRSLKRGLWLFGPAVKLSELAAKLVSVLDKVSLQLQSLSSSSCSFICANKSLSVIFKIHTVVVFSKHLLKEMCFSSVDAVDNEAKASTAVLFGVAMVTGCVAGGLSGVIGLQPNYV